MKSEIHDHYFHVQIADFPSIFVVVIFIHTVSFNIHYHFWKFESLKITNKCCQYQEEKLIHLDTVNPELIWVTLKSTCNVQEPQSNIQNHLGNLRRKGLKASGVQSSGKEFWLITILDSMCWTVTLEWWPQTINTELSEEI